MVLFHTTTKCFEFETINKIIIWRIDVQGASSAVPGSYLDSQSDVFSFIVIGNGNCNSRVIGNSKY